MEVRADYSKWKATFACAFPLISAALRIRLISVGLFNFLNWCNCVDNGWTLDAETLLSAASRLESVGVVSDVSNERLRGEGCLGVSMNTWEYDGSSEER